MHELTLDEMEMVAGGQTTWTFEGDAIPDFEALKDGVLTAAAAGAISGALAGAPTGFVGLVAGAIAGASLGAASYSIGLIWSGVPSMTPVITIEEIAPEDDGDC